MPRMVAEGVPTVLPVIIKELRIETQFLVKEKEVMVKEYTVQSGTLNFINTKKAVVIFKRGFDKIPRITLTLNNTSTTNPYVTGVNQTGFTLNFQNNWSGVVEWIAIERE